MKERDLRQPVIEWLEDLGYRVVLECAVMRRMREDFCPYNSYGSADIVGGHYGPRPSKGRIPPLLTVVAVELKIRDVAGVIRQAKDNQWQTDLSYCGMPAERIATMMPSTLFGFAAAGVGLLSIHPTSVTVIVSPEIGPGPSQRITKAMWRKLRKRFDKPKPNA